MNGGLCLLFDRQFYVPSDRNGKMLLTAEKWPKYFSKNSVKHRYTTHSVIPAANSYLHSPIVLLQWDRRVAGKPQLLASRHWEYVYQCATDTVTKSKLHYLNAQRTIFNLPAMAPPDKPPPPSPDSGISMKAAGRSPSLHTP